MDEKDRIEKVMLTEGMNSAQFAAEIGIQGSTLSHILNGRNNPSLDVLKKVLNRFRTVSSDWLILGVGPMYRGIKQSQTLSLFEESEITESKSVIYDDKNTEKSGAEISVIQKETEKMPTALEKSDMKVQPFPKLVKKIIVYYDDNTFQEFETK